MSDVEYRSLQHIVDNSKYPFSELGLRAGHIPMVSTSFHMMQQCMSIARAYRVWKSLAVMGLLLRLPLTLGLTRV